MAKKLFLEINSIYAEYLSSLSIVSLWLVYFLKAQHTSIDFVLIYRLKL